MNWKLFTRDFHLNFTYCPLQVFIGRILRLVKVKAVLLYKNFKLT